MIPKIDLGVGDMGLIVNNHDFGGKVVHHIDRLQHLCVHVHIIEPRHEISNIVVRATSKASDQPAHMRSLIRAFVSRLNIL